MFGRGRWSSNRGDYRPFASRTAARTHDLTQHLVTEYSDGRFARRQAVLREQFGYRAIGSSLLAKLRNDLPGRHQFLELLGTPRRKLRDRLPDTGWIK